jgi:electron transport complex protein RnfD
MFLVLCPQILILFFTKNFDALLVIIAALTASLAAEIIVMVKTNTSGGMLIACLQGIITGMLFPQSYPLLSVFLLTFCTFFIAKYAFGGLAGSWINVAALTVAIAFFTGSNYFPDFFDSSALQHQNPSLFFLQDGNVSILRNDASIIAFFNSGIFRVFGAFVPDGYISLLWDSGFSVPAFRFNLLILLSSIFLLSLNMINWIIPFCYLTVYLVLVWFFGGLALGGNIASGDILLASLTGGTLFTAFFLLGWFGTTPLSVKGKVLYGIGAGIIAFFVSSFGLSSSGAVFTVLASNFISTLIQFFEIKFSKIRLNTKIIPKIKLYWRITHG